MANDYASFNPERTKLGSNGFEIIRYDSNSAPLRAVPHAPRAHISLSPSDKHSCAINGLIDFKAISN